MTSMDRFTTEILQGVVHPSHIPLESESETAIDGCAGDTAPCRRLFGDHHHAREITVGKGRGLLKEADCLPILPTALIVREPLAIFSGVVEIEH